MPYTSYDIASHLFSFRKGCSSKFPHVTNISRHRMFQPSVPPKVKIWRHCPPRLRSNSSIYICAGFKSIAQRVLHWMNFDVSGPHGPSHYFILVELGKRQDKLCSQLALLMGISEGREIVDLPLDF